MDDEARCGHRPHLAWPPLPFPSSATSKPTLFQYTRVCSIRFPSWRAIVKMIYAINLKGMRELWWRVLFHDCYRGGRRCSAVVYMFCAKLIAASVWCSVVLGSEDWYGPCTGDIPPSLSDLLNFFVQSILCLHNDDTIFLMLLCYYTLGAEENFHFIDKAFVQSIKIA